MRIISGKYKGLVLNSYNIDGTRPTMDRIKESVFGIIQNNIRNSVCLDLFCGSGSLGIEALSNGASVCYFVDRNKKVIDELKKNVTNIDGCVLINDDYEKALNNFKIKFDIIFLDPPYDLFLINKAIELIKKQDLLNDNGLIICEYMKENVIDIYSLYKEKKYGDKYIKIYKK